MFLRFCLGGQDLKLYCKSSFFYFCFFSEMVAGDRTEERVERRGEKLNALLLLYSLPTNFIF